MDRKECWGQLTAIDLYDCDAALLLNKSKLAEFTLELCNRINMKPHGDPIVDQFGEGDLYGLSAIQFIETSTITVHLDDKGGRAFIDVFSCKKFDEDVAVSFSAEYYRAGKVKYETVMRGDNSMRYSPSIEERVTL